MMMDENERQEGDFQEVCAEALYESPILYALKAYVQKNGKPSEELLRGLTCVPDFIKAVMLRFDDEEAMRYYSDFFVDSMILPYEIIEAYAAENHFTEKEEWRIRLAEELDIIDKAKLFPSGIYECFAEAYLIVRDELSARALKNLHEKSLRARERRYGTLFLLDLLAHLADVTVDPDLVARFTCVPGFVKMALLNEGDCGRSYYESSTHEVGYVTMKYEIMETFILNHAFPTKKEWNEAFSSELAEIEASGYFPEKILNCFKEGFHEFVTVISIENIREIKRIIQETGERGDDHGE